MMTTRLYVENLAGESVRIEDAEAHHLIHVLRIRTGDEVELFDGLGTVALARINQVSRRHADASIIRKESHSGDLASRLTVAAAPAKGDRLRWMVEKLTELGVDRLVLLNTTRTVVHPGETRLDKLKSAVIAACKQSGRTHLMQLQSITPLHELLTEETQRTPRPSLVVAHPWRDGPNSETVCSGSGDTVGNPDTTSFEKPDQHQPVINAACRDAVLLIGPEGGFTDDEVQLILNSGGRRMEWPNTILRIETAALLFSGLLLQRLWQQPDSRLPVLE